MFSWQTQQSRTEGPASPAAGHVVGNSTCGDFDNICWGLEKWDIVVGPISANLLHFICIHAF